MKRPLQLSLAIALALGGTNALALGLGPVHVKSKLNQPLDAEIPVLQGTAGEAEGLLVSLAAAEDFERVGINRSHLGVPLDFALVKGSNGEMVIKVTSKEIIRDTYLDFLVEANWPKGRLLREYTVLLDPPVTAPARGATTSAVAAAPSTTTVKRHEPPAPAATPAPAAPTTPRAKPAPEPSMAAAPAPARKLKDGEYGPVAAGETLSGVAHATKVSGANLDQMMLALLKNNPNAFYKDNVNALKRGAILRVPSADEVKAIGSASEAAAQVHAQVEDWRGGRASPTRVADDGGSKTPAASTVATATPKAPKATAASKAADEHLALVPPKVGKDSVAMADRPGSGAGSAAATSELKSELARTKETLTTQQQEAGELKSRVKELEDLKSKNDRLIGLKDSEIAELQQKLKQMQEKSTVSTAKATTPVPTPATTPKATTVVPAPPAASTTPSTTPSTATPTATTTKTPAPSVGSTTAPTATTPASSTKIDKQDIWGEPSTASTTPADAGKTPVDTSKTAVSDASKTTTPADASKTTLPAATVAGSTTTPSATSPVSTTTPLPSAPATTSAPVAPKATTPAKVAKVQPATVSAPWYEASWVKPAALGAGVLLLLGGIFGLRKRKVAPAGNGRGSIADSFGQSPLKPAGTAAAGSLEAEEESLREQLQMDPSNVGLHLELLSLYYAERDVSRFEDAAADMHVHVEDAHQPEWLEAQAMGQELAPHNPLFSGIAHFDDGDATIASAHADTLERPRYDAHNANVTAPSRLAPRLDTHDHAPHAEDLGFNLGHDDFAAPASSTNAVAKHDESFDFTLPPLDLEAPVTPSRPAAAPAAPKAAADLDDDYFPGEDAIGTKLDLAKAYMDMGDPDGARSMLEEVVAEGSDAQKAEAHRLIAEIR